MPTGQHAAKSKSSTAPRKSKSMPAKGRNPQGGLTAEGRKYFADRDGSHLRPGVTGPADTPDKLRRKGSFLARTFTHPRGPMEDENGEPTRLALSAHAWGEPIPKTMAAAKKLGQLGHKLLEQYHAAKDTASKGPVARKATRAQAQPVVPKKAGAKKSRSVPKA